MFKEIVVVDNFLKDPNSIVELAVKQKYYACNDNPNNYTVSDNTFYNGKRTLALKRVLSNIDSDNINNEILTTLFNLHIPHHCKVNVEAEISCLFHSLMEQDVYDINNMHTDTVLFAGVIYLNKNLDSDNHGTIVNNNIIPYKFNRLVMYRTDMMHCPLNGYGNSIHESRLTLNIFINKINITATNNKGDRQ